MQSASFWLVQPAGQHPSPFVQDVLGIEEQEAEQLPGLEQVYVRHGLEPQLLAWEQARVWQEPEQHMPDEHAHSEQEQVSPGSQWMSPHTGVLQVPPTQQEEQSVLGLK